ncbi:hypothetical protein ABB37_05670 [Leptomonas pyrrhocoris]|uniref:Vps72/YL1 N-terminal domain-containing protein n=1 Tax=Leptomonas pyrrhocoris TaxID=157538 RepID=A0A0N0DUN2_LEPPY|nr:hypothetical protein ABB37_05670 [Leptomonas pyrrhocoris]XP_015657608.1 hypothetical protein ABB37_05670 [Leptomonas pyrrhocoris]KPA79168.1 hypothetical protein ABB37_05670 [Leptomonas pyrrhocoris]KPA79169.1 hypothetical protein ABB37_05670 [Leptomonas pyrrhocoris]|eukprot:XP_015657607.1 hypothetical protein ABB37_05670 [Leptomonas pyrrhocoris]
MEWADDVANRPRRANAGSRLQELLQNGLDEEDEKDLQRWDNSSSDTSFTLGSDEETIDEVDSDFDAEEVAGVLEGEAVETEATVRRAERQERQRERKRRLQRTQNFSKAAAHTHALQKKLQERQKDATERQRRRKRERDGSNDSSSSLSTSTSSEDDSTSGGDGEKSEVPDLRQQVRHRPAPTISCARRLAEAHDRAAAHRAAQAALAEQGGGGGGDEGPGDAAAMLNTHRGLNVGRTRHRPRRNAGRFGETVLNGGVAGRASPSMPVFVSPRIALYHSVPQRIRYCSGVSVLAMYKVPSILSFSERLPAVFLTQSQKP